MSCYAHNRPTL